jgi:hypothetical protein
VNPTTEICKVGFQILGVFGPRHLIDTWCCRLLQAKEACAQRICVDVMQKRRQFLFSVPGDGYSYATLRL